MRGHARGLVGGPQLGASRAPRRGMETGAGRATGGAAGVVELVRLVGGVPVGRGGSCGRVAVVRAAIQQAAGGFKLTV